MIRIVGVQRSQSPEREFVLLQNQGSLRISLRGHVIMSESALDNSDLANAAHALTDDVLIPPGTYVLLATGVGQPRWVRTKDGIMVYYAYMNRTESVWNGCVGPLHVLGTQHTYAERANAVYLR